MYVFIFLYPSCGEYVYVYVDRGGPDKVRGHILVRE
jgi:hypothetical protein